MTTKKSNKNFKNYLVNEVKLGIKSANCYASNLKQVEALIGLKPGGLYELSFVKLNEELREFLTTYMDGKYRNHRSAVRAYLKYANPFRVVPQRSEERFVHFLQKIYQKKVGSGAFIQDRECAIANGLHHRTRDRCFNKEYR